MLEIGSLVDGKYKILNVIGKGGMSVVYLAMNERANKQWAIKEVRKDGVSNFEVVKQGLIVETDLLKKLNHPNLPSIVDVIDGDGTFLIVMDYIEGNPLNKILKQKGAQPQEDVIEWAKQLCDVLGYLHSREKPIIYRDMKPANIMLKHDGKIMLIDFGTAREFKEKNVADTTCLGTQGYAAPEQFGGQGQTDARTDIYCLGATMYHLVTGHNPAEPPYEMYPIRKWNPKLSSGLEEIILKCTQRNPKDRYQNCAELLYALEHYRDLENEAKREYKKKWRLFLGSTIATVLCLGGTVGFGMAENSKIQSTYDYYIEKGEESANGGEFKAAADAYKQAIEVAPEKGDAYKNYLDKVILSDDVFSAEESKEILQIIKGSGDTENLEVLKEKNKSDYDEFAYNLAEAYYYFYYDVSEGHNKAGKWYNIVAKSKNLDSRKVTIAKALSNIISYSNELSNPTYKANGEKSVSFAEYWKDLNTVVDVDYEKINARMVSIKVYVNFNASVMQYQESFNNEDITNEQLVDKLKSVYDKMLYVQEQIKDKNNAYVSDKGREELEKGIDSIKYNIDTLEKEINKTK